MMCNHPVHSDVVGGIRPCGQCRHCRTNQRRKKSTRLLLESFNHVDALFVTLTYSQEFLPTELYCPDTGTVTYSHPTGCLDKRAISLFVKRLRRRFPPKTIRVFYAGEYGDKNQRPHYHLLIWGIPFSKKHLIYESWTDPHTQRLMCDPDYLDVQQPRSDWEVSQYCCAYIDKRMTSPDDVRLQGRPPEFSHGSKALGAQMLPMLVSAMLQPSAQNYIQMHGDIPRIFIHNGKKFPLDRYLRGKLLDELRILEQATLVGAKKFAEEMQTLRDRAIYGTDEKTQKLKKLLFDVEISKPALARAMERQHEADSSQLRKLADRKSELYNSNNGDF